jgi:formylmethanofuran dehydrogenase subunit C
VSAFTFTVKAPPPERCDLSALTPHGLAGAAAPERLLIGTTRRGLRVGDIFTVRRGDPADIVVEGGSERFDRVGAGLSGGSIRVTGDVGQLAGRGMRGGTIRIEGACGRLAGSAMAGGRIDILGDAGDLVGGPLPGEASGMRRGTIHVHGRAGGRLGDRMRRGTIVVERGMGEAAGSRLLGGTIVCFGGAGARLGTLMRRGTVVLCERDADCGVTFVDAGAHDLVFMRLLAKQLSADGVDASRLAARRRRLIGDTAVTGKGEILLPA